MTYNLHDSTRTRPAVLVVKAILCTLAIASSGLAQNPSGVYSPVQLDPPFPYRVELRPYSMGDVDVPTLHSYAVGKFDNKWLFISGRTNGLHGFDASTPEENFPPLSQNRDVWVMDIESRQTWHRPLDDQSSGLSEAQVLSLSNTNNQFYQKEDTLYITGGYGVFENGDFGTFDTLSAIDLPGLGDWVTGGSGSAAEHIRQIQDPVFRVTGGAMHAIQGRTHLVFGQDFQGVYAPFSNGTYTNQVRSFDIVDDGVNLSIQDISQTTPDPNYRRRDLNVVPVLRPDGGGLDEGLVVFSGVFTPQNGPWTVPVEIDENGNPTMADPNDPNTFQQGMNNYHSAKLGLFSESSGEMHEILFGGISLQFLNPATQMIETDNQLPFVNDITSVVVDADGSYSQHHLGFFPELFDTQGRRLRLGANAEFLAADGLPTFENGVFKLDELPLETTLGYIFGGIIANVPHVRQDPEGLSSASNHVFEVVLIQVPEPSAAAMILLAVLSLGGFRRRYVVD